MTRADRIALVALYKVLTSTFRGAQFTGINADDAATALRRVLRADKPVRRWWHFHRSQS